MNMGARRRRLRTCHSKRADLSTKVTTATARVFHHVVRLSHGSQEDDDFAIRLADVFVLRHRVILWSRRSATSATLFRRVGRPGRCTALLIPLRGLADDLRGILGRALGRRRSSSLNRRRVRESFLSELRQFGVGQISPRADSQPSESDWTESRSAKSLHRMPEVGHQLADATIAAFAQLHCEDGPFSIAAQNVKVRRPRYRLRVVAVSREISGARSNRRGCEDPLLKACDILRAEIALHHHLVLLVNLVPRMCQSIGKFAIISHQEKSARIEIQSADWVEACLTRMLHQFSHESTTLWIGVGADEPRWLVQHDIDVTFRWTKHSPVDGDSILGWIDPRRKRVDHFAIDTNESLLDHRLSIPPRREPGIGDRLLNADSSRSVGQRVRWLSSATWHLRKVAFSG